MLLYVMTNKEKEHICTVGGSPEHQSPLPRKGAWDTEQVVEYLGRYTHRVAISNSRMGSYIPKYFTPLILTYC